MTTYLDLLNRARQRQGSLPINSVSIGDNSGDSLQGIAAVRNAVAIFYKNSFDLDADEKVATITTTPGNSVLPPPTDTWDTNVIKTIKYQKTGIERLLPLQLVTLEQSEDLKLQSFQDNDPQFWWVNNMVVYLLPVPTTTYTLKAFYQKLYPDITADDMSSTIMLSSSALQTLEDGVYAFLRENLGDPQAELYKSQYLADIKLYYQRNKHTYKRRAINRFSVLPRRGDRKL